MKFKIMLLVVAAVLVSSNYVFAAECHDRSQDNYQVKAGNELCPVSGENIKSMGDGIEHEYDGKIYNLCCSGCADTFRKDAKKYSEIVEKNAAEQSVKEEHKEGDHPH